MNPIHGLRVVFMGTADFAVPSLRAMVDAGCVVPLVVTRPDKPVGRGLEMSMTPVKTAALELGLEVFQPAGLRDTAVQDRLRACDADFFVVAAYGRILPSAVLRMPRLGCVNVHGSILPSYRGAAPIQWAVINGESETGVTIMMMDEGCDTGDILLIGRTPISATDTAATLFERLSQMGPPLLLQALGQLACGAAVRIAQDHSLATVAPMIDKSVGLIDWTSSSRSIANLVRGVDPWPGAFTFTPDGTRIRVFPFLREASESVAIPDSGAALPGTVLVIGCSGDGTGRGDSMLVRTGDGAVVVDAVQAAGARRMAPAAMAAGRRIAAGQVLCMDGVRG